MRILAPQSIRLVDLNQIKRQLETEGVIPDKTVDELYNFGEVMLNEVSQRIAQIDHKLYSVLGWSSAMLTFLLLTKEFGVAKAVVGWFSATAAVLSLACIILCSLGIKSSVTMIHSEFDWFCSELYLHSDRMKRSHLLRLLDIHQRQSQIAASRADFLGRAEILFIVSLVAVIAAIVIQSFFVSH